jgi:hypothetical protein
MRHYISLYSLYILDRLYVPGSQVLLDDDLASQLAGYVTEVEAEAEAETETDKKSTKAKPVSKATE